MKDNESQPIFKAKISAFGDKVDEHGCPLEARVVPVTTPNVVTRLFPILWICRGHLGDLKVDDLVVCARYEDGDGIIICRADGEHTNHFPKDLVIEGDATIEGNLHVNKDVTVDGREDVTGDVKGAGISLSTHTHPGVHGQTGGPT